MRVAVALLWILPGLAAQTDPEIREAIAHLGGERLDVAAMERLIDAGSAAVGPLLATLDDAAALPDDPRHARVLRTLRAIGPDAAERACSELLVLVRDPRLSNVDGGRALALDLVDTVSELVLLAPETAPGVSEEVDSRWFRRQDLPLKLIGPVETFRLLRRSAAVADEAARPSLRALDFVERELAADLLGPDDTEALPELLEVLEEDAQPRVTSVLTARGQHQLTANVRQTRSIVLDAVSRAIARIDPGHPKAGPGLAQMVEDAADPRDRVEAAMALGRQGEAARSHCEPLIRALDSDEERLVAESITSLAMIDARQDDVLARLRELAEDPRPAIAKRAAASLEVLTRE